MDYEEFTRNVGKASLTVKQFAELIHLKPNTLTNLKSKEENIVPNHLAIIASLLGEMVDKGIAYQHLFDKLELKEQKPRRQKNDSFFVKKQSRK